MPLRWGIVATGWISATLTEEIGRVDGCDVVAVSSRTAERAQQFAAEHGIPRSYASVEELVADDEVDVVYVGSTHQHHAAATRLALEAGKHVLCEKPFTLTAAESAELVALARARGLFLMEAMWMRCIPAFRRLREMVLAGELGRIRHVAASLGARPGGEATYRFTDPNLGGGALLDMGIYPLTFAHALLGDPDGIAAAAVVDGGVDLTTSVALSWRDPGATASLATSIVGVLPNDAAVVGERARIHVPAGFHAAAGFTIMPEGSGPAWIDVPFRSRGWVHEVEEVARCVEAGLTESPLVPLDHTVAIMRLADAVRDEIGLRYPADR